MKSCTRVSAILLPGPFLDEKQELLPKLQWGSGWQRHLPERECKRCPEVLRIIMMTNPIAAIIVTHIC